MNPSDWLHRFAGSVTAHPALAVLVAIAAGLLTTST